jgi:hypothetical protein
MAAGTVGVLVVVFFTTNALDPLPKRVSSTFHQGPLTVH